MGIILWGLGIGDWPNPQSPIPNPQSPQIQTIDDVKLKLIIIQYF